MENGYVKPKLKEIRDYRDSSAVNQSLLKGIESGYVKRKRNTISMCLGSLLDAYLCVNELLEDLFIIADNRPTDIICNIVEFVFNNSLVLDNNNLEDFKKEIILSFNTYSYQANWKIDTKVNTVIIKGSEYFELLKKKGEKEIVTLEECINSANTVGILYNTEPAKSVLLSVTQFQVALYGICEGVRIKGLLDCISIDENNKHIIITDIKRTEYPLSQLKKVIEKFQYIFQLSFYRFLVKFNYPEYTVSCQLLFISAFNSSSCVWKISDTDMDFYECGYYIIEKSIFSEELDKTIVSTEYKKGWKNLLNIFKQCKEIGLNHFDLNLYYKNYILNESIFD